MQDGITVILFLFLIPASNMLADPATFTLKLYPESDHLQHHLNGVRT